MFQRQDKTIGDLKMVRYGCETQDDETFSITATRLGVRIDGFVAVTDKEHLAEVMFVLTKAWAQYLHIREHGSAASEEKLLAHLERGMSRENAGDDQAES